MTDDSWIQDPHDSTIIWGMEDDVLVYRIIDFAGVIVRYTLMDPNRPTVERLDIWYKLRHPYNEEGPPE